MAQSVTTEFTKNMEYQNNKLNYELFAKNNDGIDMNDFRQRAMDKHKYWSCGGRSLLANTSWQLVYEKL